MPGNNRRSMGKRNSTWNRTWKQLKRFHDPKDVGAAKSLAALLLVGEALLCCLIIWRVPYTEIDWQAYMSEVTGYQEGQLDYQYLKGDTGPLVYPAGFVYLFSFLRNITGEAILPAQIIFAGLYLASQAVVMALYIRAGTMPPWSLVLLCASRRLHSIFVLRLFNDCWCMFVAYLATLALQSKRWVLAVLLYSLAVSIKMNVLLMAPGVLAVLLKGATVKDLLRGVAAGVLLQLVLGAPFLLTFPGSYISRAFEMTRVFQFVWTVNWKFLPESWFLSPRLALLLLATHLRLLWAFAGRRWFYTDGGFTSALSSFWRRTSSSSISPDGVLYCVFSANFIGILCARTLHYQFYSWYFHTLPFLLWRTRLPKPVTMATFVLIEFVWNIFPSTSTTSAALLALHLLVLSSCWLYPEALPQDRYSRRRRGSRR